VEDLKGSARSLVDFSIISGRTEAARHISTSIDRGFKLVRSRRMEKVLCRT